MPEDLKLAVWEHVKQGERISPFFVARKHKIDIVLAHDLCQWAWRANAYRWFRIRCGLEEVDINFCQENSDINLCHTG